MERERKRKGPMRLMPPLAPLPPSGRRGGGAAQRDLAPQTRASILPAFCSFGLLWPVMALACGSLHTAVTFVPNGWHIGY
jgi:hypothetical protein